MKFELKKSYNFSTLAPTLLGNNYTNMKVIAILTADNAIEYRDIATLQAQVKSTITGLPDSTTDLSYILFKNNITSEKLVLPLEYIEDSSIVETTTLNIRIEVRNCTIDDVGTLRTRLEELGYADGNITTY